MLCTAGVSIKIQRVFCKGSVKIDGEYLQQYRAQK